LRLTQAEVHARRASIDSGAAQPRAPRAPYSLPGTMTAAARRDVVTWGLAAQDMGAQSICFQLGMCPCPGWRDRSGRTWPYDRQNGPFLPSGQRKSISRTLGIPGSQLAQSCNNFASDLSEMDDSATVDVERPALHPECLLDAASYRPDNGSCDPARRNRGKLRVSARRIGAGRANQPMPPSQI